MSTSVSSAAPQALLASWLESNQVPTSGESAATAVSGFGAVTFTADWLVRFVLACLVAFIPHYACAQIPSWGVDDFKAPPDLVWRDRALQDVTAAYQFIKANHPGAEPQLDDRMFVARLEAAHRKALARARLVVSAQGYNAVLAGFATNLEDKHIFSRPTLVVNLPYWTGAVLGKQGDNLVVVANDGAVGSPLPGARLMSCDGVPANELARRNLEGFRAAWRIEAQQYQAVPWLFVDESNPFVRRPETCVFSTPQGTVTTKLNWKRIKREELIPRLRAAGGGGAAGFGIRKVGNGFWISLQDLMERGAAVATEVEARQGEIRRSPFVVIDVRGNGGGSSDVGARLARAIWGAERVNAVEGSDDEDCGDDLRASPGNVADMEYILKALDAVLSPEARVNLEKQVAAGRDALAHGRAFNRPPVCRGGLASPPASGKRDLLPIAGSPKVVLLTDNLCFSACLVLTADFRRLGALHLGQTTDAATHYTEVREQYLPSGYSLFSTLQAVAPGEPTDVGPFVPDRIYRDNIAETPAVEQWVLDQVGQPTSPAAPASRP